MLLQEFNGCVRVAGEDGVLELAVLIEFVTVAVRNNLGEATVPEAALCQFRAETDEDL